MHIVYYAYKYINNYKYINTFKETNGLRRAQLIRMLIIIKKKEMKGNGYIRIFMYVYTYIYICRTNVRRTKSVRIY